MTREEWDQSSDATAMLRALYVEKPKRFRKQLKQVHRFLIACSWKQVHLIPQESIREGLKGGEKWIAGEIDNEELNRLNYHAEGAAFFLDYCKKPEDIRRIEAWIAGIKQLNGTSFEAARDVLKRAAYFGQGSMIYPTLRPGPWIGRLFDSEFVCADLLREHLAPILPD